MVRVLKLLATLVGGAVLGLLATWFATAHQPPFGAVRSGPWTAWPAAGSPEPDPYALAGAARSGAVPLANGAGLGFLATADDAGASLDGRCSYEIGGPTPQAQYWTLSLLDPRGFVVKTALPRHGFTSAEPVRDAAGAFRIVVAAEARPGNWLPAPSSGRFQLLLNFYDTPLAAALQQGSPAPALPAIVKLACS